MLIGVIVQQSSEFYKVDIGSNEEAYLPCTSFDGATKRNRPMLKENDVIYCRVLSVNRDMEPELTCCSIKKKKDWVTGDSQFGELKGGYIFDCSLSLCKHLLDPKCMILKAIGEKVSYEIAIGMNGKVWVSSESPKLTIHISMAIQNSENMNEMKIKEMVKKLFQKK